MAECIILNDITPRMYADYGYAMPIRSVGAYRISTALSNEGFDTEIIDFFFYLDKKLQRAVLDKLIDEKTFLLGFSNTNLRGNTKFFDQTPLKHTGDLTEQRTDSVFYFWEIARDTIAYIKKNFPWVKIIIGGGQLPSFQPWAANYVDKNIDYIVTGESDVSVVKLANHIKNNFSIKFEKKWLLNGNKMEFTNTRIIHSTKDYPLSKEYVQNCLDINHKSISSRLLPNEWISVESSRGCIFNCYFCSYAHSNKRRSVKSIKQEIISNYENFGITTFRFMDDTFNDDYNKVKEITTMLKSLPFNVEWHTYARADIFYKYPDMADMMYDAGCRYIKFGLESTTDIVLRTTNKSMPHSKIAKVLENIDRRTNGDLYMHSNFIIGLPLETPETQRQTFEYIKNSPLTTFSCTTYFRDLHFEEEQDYRTMSEFGKKSFDEKVGFEGAWGWWKHNGMNSDQANDLYNELMENIQPVQPYFVGSDMYPILRMYGVEHKKIKNEMAKAVNFYKTKDTSLVQWQEEKFISLLTQYIKKLKEDLNINIQENYFIPDTIYTSDIKVRKEYYKILASG